MPIESFVCYLDMNFSREQWGKADSFSSDYRTIFWIYGNQVGTTSGKASEKTSKLHAPLIREVYWVHNPKNDAEKIRGVFLCSDPEQGRGFGRLFVQEVTSKNRLCPKYM